MECSEKRLCQSELDPLISKLKVTWIRKIHSTLICQYTYREYANWAFMLLLYISYSNFPKKSYAFLLALILGRNVTGTGTGCE
jgi:hypothetical protein